jgi:hypothetical protein
MTNHRPLRERFYKWQQLHPHLTTWTPALVDSMLEALLAAPAPSQNENEATGLSGAKPGCSATRESQTIGQAADDGGSVGPRSAATDKLPIIAREAPAYAPPATPTPGLDRACLNCEGHGVVRHYLNRAGDYDKSHCPICGGTGKEKRVPSAPTGDRS